MHSALPGVHAAPADRTRMCVRELIFENLVEP
jgi:hypothetical protein